jgi:hypothetical protein
MSCKPTYSYNEQKVLRIPAHALEDAVYVIKGDKWEDTRYGWHRALILTKDEQTFKVWLPKSCNAPNVILTGHKVEKSSISSQLINPYYGYTYLLEFIMQPCYDIPAI